MGGGADPEVRKAIVSRPPGRCDNWGRHLNHLWPSYDAEVAIFINSSWGDSYSAACPLCAMVSGRWEVVGVWVGDRWEALDVYSDEGEAQLERLMALRLLEQYDAFYAPGRVSPARLGDTEALDLLTERFLQWRWLCEVIGAEWDQARRDAALAVSAARLPFEKEYLAICGRAPQRD